MSVSISDQIACVRREIALRRNVYKKRVNAGQMQPAQARRELDAMQAVHDTLTAVAAEGIAPETA